MIVGPGWPPAAGDAHGWRRYPAGEGSGVFLFFSNRLGCLGSLLLSAALTVLLLIILGALR